MIGLRDLNTDAVPSTPSGRQARCTCATERVEHHVTDKAEHANEALGQFNWVWRWMEASGGPRNPKYLIKPRTMLLLADEAENPHRFAWPSVPSWLSEHQYVLDVILDDSIGLVRLTEKRCAVLNLERGVGDLVPNDRREVVEP